MVLLIIALTLLAILGSLLIFPIRLIINTDQNYYMAGMPGIIVISAIPDEVLFHLKARILFVPFKIKGENIIRKGTKTFNKRTKQRTKSKIKLNNNSLNRFRAFTRSIKIKQLYLNFDTYNPVSNAIIGSLFTPILNNQKNINIDINYSGDYSARIFLQSRIILILYAFIKK